MNFISGQLRPDPLMVIRDLHKSYRRGGEEVAIFRGLSLDIGRGEFVAMMGPSGSGKTTLLNLLGGIDRADSGEIRFDGARIDQLTQSQLTRWRGRNLGFVFQFYNLMPMLTAAQNVELPLLLYPLSRAQRQHQVATALDIVGIADRARHRPKELSGGQQQRVAIARALVTDPKLILADEPTGDLDRASADGVLAIMRSLCEDMGKTIVMVTHDPAAAAAASRRLELDKGEFMEKALNR
jgi:putative ABC transport system ATP-binding protein